mmetsp:Transcript_16544/g.14446  ORF Transcript_16544/g.14446 Transcript_16544/m.14446 type:complete len:227 (+) Transcript_16544:11-691(+)
MGNIMAIDIGIVLASITIFDKKNSLFPRKIKESGKANSVLQNSSYFEVDQSFYSTQHGGTFHFAHFNIHYFEEFIKSKAFETLIEFVEENSEINRDSHLLTKLEKLNMVFEEPISLARGRSNSTPVTMEKKIRREDKKSESEETKESSEAPKIGGGFPSITIMEKIKEKYGTIKNLMGVQLLCTGGYNNNFLELIAFLLNVNIYKIHGYMETLISAIDFQNTNSND